MMTRRLVLRLLLVLPGMLPMTSIPAAPPRPADPMRGPDFVMEKVTSWVEHPGADSELTLADGSRWHLETHRADYAALASFIARTKSTGDNLLVSGDRANGGIDRVGAARALAVQQIDDHEVDGKVVVLFHGPPSAYRVRVARPGAAHDLALLRRSATSKAFLDTPDLLVGIDVRAKEVVAVKPLAGGSGAASGAGAPVPRQ
jgi:hypothetical protein